MRQFGSRKYTVFTNNCLLRSRIMFIKVITLVSLASIGYGKVVTNIDDQEPNHAVSSKNMYHPEDQYNEFQGDSTPQPASTDQIVLHGKQYSASPMLQSTTNIQYAPLLSTDEQRYQNGIQPKTHSPHDVLIHSNIEMVKITVKKDHLEPKLREQTKPRVLPHAYKRLEYVPGHNIEVLQSVNREPVRNILFRNNSGLPNDNNIQSVLDMRDNRQTTEKSTQTIQTTQAPLTTTVAPSTHTNPVPLKMRNNDKFEFILDQYYRPKKNGYQLNAVKTPRKAFSGSKITEARPTMRTTQLPDLEKNSYPKLRSLILNVARTYNLGLAPHKTSGRITGSNISWRQPFPVQSLMKVPGAVHLQVPPPEFTLLYPVQTNLRFAVN